MKREPSSDSNEVGVSEAFRFFLIVAAFGVGRLCVSDSSNVGAVGPLSCRAPQLGHVSASFMMGFLQEEHVVIGGALYHYKIGRDIGFSSP